MLFYHAFEKIAFKTKNNQSHLILQSEFYLLSQTRKVVFITTVHSEYRTFNKNKYSRGHDSYSRIPLGKCS